MAAAVPGKTAKPPSPAVQKTFAIIELFASDNGGHSLSDISRRLKLPVSTTSALLKTMQQCGYVTRTERGFCLSTKLLTEATKALNQMELHQVAESALTRLARATQLTAILLTRDRDQMVCVHKVDGISDIRIASHVGRRFHMHFTCTGKAVLAQLSDEEVMSIVAATGLPRNTPKTITSLDELRKELQRVRSRGYAVDDEEFATHIRGVGAAVFDHTGRPIGGIAVAGGADEIGGKMPAIIDEVKNSALRVSRLLGYSTAGFGREHVHRPLRPSSRVSLKSRSSRRLGA